MKLTGLLAATIVLHLLPGCAVDASGDAPGDEDLGTTEEEICGAAIAGHTWKASASQEIFETTLAASYDHFFEQGLKEGEFVSLRFGSGSRVSGKRVTEVLTAGWNTGDVTDYRKVETVRGKYRFWPSCQDRRRLVLRLDAPLDYVEKLVFKQTVYGGDILTLEPCARENGPCGYDKEFNYATPQAFHRNN